MRCNERVYTWVGSGGGGAKDDGGPDGGARRGVFGVSTSARSTLKQVALDRFIIDQHACILIKTSECICESVPFMFGRTRAV